jgi:formylglycine-generating enzyme required for sulfatase activity
MGAETTKAASGPAPAPDMVWIPAAGFMMGSDSHQPEEAPARQAYRVVRLLRSSCRVKG